MKSVLKLLKRIITLILAGTFTIIVAACYGVFVDYRYLFCIRDPQGIPIPGIQVSLMLENNEEDREFSDQDGHAIVETTLMNPVDDFSVSLIDVDGPLNSGSFEPVHMTIDAHDTYSANDGSYTDTYDVTMYTVE